MVQAAVPHRKFDGLRPEDVVFGETLGEGKSQSVREDKEYLLPASFRKMLTISSFLHRCLRPCLGGLAAQ